MSTIVEIGHECENRFDHKIRRAFDAKHDWIFNENHFIYEEQIFFKINRIERSDE